MREQNQREPNNVMHLQDHLSCDCSIIVNVKLHESVGDLVHLVFRGDVGELFEDLKQENDHLLVMMMFIGLKLPAPLKAPPRRLPEKHEYYQF